MGSEGPHPPGRAARGGTGDGAASRRARGTGASDARASRARELHRKAAEADEVAARHRAERDRLVHQLRAEDPERWTYTAIAAALGCSRELVALIARRAR